MARGTKLSLDIGADFSDDWQQVAEVKKLVKMELLEPKKHFLIFKKEKRRGKTVTLVGPFGLEKKEADALLKKLKKKLGCGGSFKEEFMEFQGDLQRKLREYLEAESFRFKHKKS
ncbi:MAG: translation initiation factor [Epsilonproteobacteria bacterium]|nr:MAG: translation initiation factor [Campylobacterota bacterium]